MTQIYNQCGVDSFKGILSAMIHYVSDASLYIIPFYCSYYGIKKYDKILCLGLFINILYHRKQIFSILIATKAPR